MFFADEEDGQRPSGELPSFGSEVSFCLVPKVTLSYLIFYVFSYPGSCFVCSSLNFVVWPLKLVEGVMLFVSTNMNFVHNFLLHL